MTIFGFNTDIRYGDTVYHVQTEAHESDHTVQTAIFVRGRCLDRRKVPYRQEAAGAHSSESDVHELLTRQHKFVLSCIRDGKIESLINMHPSAEPLSWDAPSIDNSSQNSGSIYPNEPIPVPVAPVSVDADSGNSDVLDLPTPQIAPACVQPEPQPLPVAKELNIECVAPQSVSEAGSVLMRYRLTSGSSAVEGAKLIARLEIASIPSAYCRAITDCEGEAEVTFTLSPNTKPGDQLSITVQASHVGQTTARRFRLSRS